MFCNKMVFAFNSYVVCNKMVIAINSNVFVTKWSLHLVLMFFKMVIAFNSYVLSQTVIALNSNVPVIAFKSNVFCNKMVIAFYSNVL